jgi:hypothetical protein
VAAGDQLFHLSFIEHIALLDEMRDEADLAEENFDKADVGHSGFGTVVGQDNHYVAAVVAFCGKGGRDDAEVIDLRNDWLFAVVNLGAEFFDVAIADTQFCKSFGVAWPAVALFADDYHHWPIFGQNVKYLPGNLFVEDAAW